MNTWKTCVAILAVIVAAAAHAVGTHGTRWVETQKVSPEAASTGSWSVEVQDGKGLWASTKGDRGALGQYCSDDGACAWLLVLWNATCSEGEQHPVLVNTDRAASHHIIQCIGAVPGLGSALAFVEFDRVDFAVRGAAVVGIAIPERTDTINVAHFKLDGAAAAIDRMRARIVAQARAE
jgi:hypothetical protein